MENEKPLIYTVTKMSPVDKHNVLFTIEIIDEYTLQVLEKKYPGRLQFDGGRIFTLQVQAPIRGLSEREPVMWHKMLEEKPELVRAFVLARLKGEA
jgi:hypothetical protein